VVSTKDAPPAPGSRWAVALAEGALHVFGPDGARIDNNGPAPAGNSINGMTEEA
jgi:multiple sugar transport system ATP-binding protein